MSAAMEKAEMRSSLRLVSAGVSRYPAEATSNSFTPAIVEDEAPEELQPREKIILSPTYDT
jgi:hypothetical protein